MFTKADYLEYFQQIASFEQEMIFKLDRCIKLIDDDDIRLRLKAVSADEARHYSFIREIIDDVDKEI